MRTNPPARMPQAFSYKDAEHVLAKTRRGNLGNNTTIRRDGDDIVIRLYATDIIRYCPDGGITLRSGGHQTVTTKGRINGFLSPYLHIAQVKGDWFVGGGQFSEDVPFFEGITIYPDGRVEKYHGEVRRNPPRGIGKFLDTVEEMVYGCDHDQQMGNVDEHGWFGLVSGMTLPEARECAERQEIDMDDFNNDVQQYHWPLNAIIKEMGDGSILMQTYKNNREAIKTWHEIADAINEE